MCTNVALGVYVQNTISVPPQPIRPSAQGYCHTSSAQNQGSQLMQGFVLSPSPLQQFLAFALFPVPLPFANGTCFLQPRKYNHIIPLLGNLGCASQMQHLLSLAFKALCKQPQSAASLPIIISYIFHAPDTVNEFLFLRIAILFYHGILICFSQNNVFI